MPEETQYMGDLILHEISTCKISRPELGRFLVLFYMRTEEITLQRIIAEFFFCLTILLYTSNTICIPKSASQVKWFKCWQNASQKKENYSHYFTEERSLSGHLIISLNQYSKYQSSSS